MLGSESVIDVGSVVLEPSLVLVPTVSESVTDVVNVSESVTVTVFDVSVSVIDVGDVSVSESLVGNVVAVVKSGPASLNVSLAVAETDSNVSEMLLTVPAVPSVSEVSPGVIGCASSPHAATRHDDKMETVSFLPTTHAMDVVSQDRAWAFMGIVETIHAVAPQGAKASFWAPPAGARGYRPRRAFGSASSRRMVRATTHAMAPSASQSTVKNASASTAAP
jgi:hypothetical protein